MTDPLTRDIKRAFGVPAHVKDFTITVRDNGRPRVAFSGSMVAAAPGAPEALVRDLDLQMTSYDVTRRADQVAGAGSKEKGAGV